MTDWLTAYRTNKNVVWIKAQLTNGHPFYTHEFKIWPSIIDSFERQRIYFTKLSLQFRSHEVELDITDCDGIYLVKSVIGSMTGDTKETITFGKIQGNHVYKTVYLSPELIVDESYVDTLANCFEEAIIYDKTVTN